MAGVTNNIMKAAVEEAKKHDVNHAARKYGVSVSSIEKWKQELAEQAEVKQQAETDTSEPRKKRNYKRYSDRIKQEACEYLKDHTITETSIRFKIPENTIRNWQICYIAKQNEKAQEAANTAFIQAIEEKLRAAETECAKYREMLDIAKGLIK